MASETFQCSVITPEAQVYDDQVEAVVVPAHDGEIGILLNRAPLLCKLGAGRLRVRRGQDEQSWFVDGGFAQVLDNKVTVLTQEAVPIDELDAAAAEAMLGEARKIKVTDEVSARKKARMEASARAQLRIVHR